MSEIAQSLTETGFSVWWDRHIRAGTDFSAEIEREIASARAVVVLWSDASHDSQWVRDEAAYARDRNKLIPVRIDASTPPLGFGQVQSISLDGSRQRDTAFAELCGAVRRLMDGDAAQAIHATRAMPRERNVRWLSLGAALLIGVAIALSSVLDC